MEVELNLQIMLPYLNKYIQKGTILKVIGEQDIYWICEDEELNYILVLKSVCKIIKK